MTILTPESPKTSENPQTGLMNCHRINGCGNRRLTPFSVSNHYLREGYPIASGVIEGACRHVVKDRMERTGMNWIISGAKAMLGLRCIYLSGAWDDFVDSRCASETQRLHPHRKMLDALHWQTAA